MSGSVRRKSNAHGKGRFAKIFYDSASQNLSHTGECKANKFDLHSPHGFEIPPKRNRGD